MKLNSVQLSRVISQHAAGLMRRKGTDENGACCLFQAADADALKWTSSRVKMEIALRWFDVAYKPSWTVEQFLSQLQTQGLA